MRSKFGTKFPDRNRAICAAYVSGERMASLARRHGLSKTMIHYIVCRAGLRPWQIRPHVRTMMWAPRPPPTAEEIAAQRAADERIAREKAASLHAVMSAVFPD
jgi:transposase-like protein